MADEPTLRVLPNALRSKRLGACLNQDELAQESGVSVATIREIEGGRARGTRPGTVRKLAGALSCEPSEISEVAAATGAAS